MPAIHLTRRKEEALRRIQEKYEQIKSELDDIGFVVQGSVTERWKKCGKPACRCYNDPDEWHGPYYQWSWKIDGKTFSVSLTKEQATLCRQWGKNNKKIETIIKRLRKLSLRATRIYDIAKK